jgi:hypothetical protein
MIQALRWRDPLPTAEGHAAAPRRRKTSAVPLSTAACQFAVKCQVTETEVLRLTSLLKVTGPLGSKLT